MIMLLLHHNHDDAHIYVHTYIYVDVYFKNMYVCMCINRGIVIKIHRVNWNDLQQNISRPVHYHGEYL